MKTGGGAGARGPGRGAPTTPTTLAEINVTPLVDVMLVLLIVFMVSAPLMQQGAQVELPKANTGHLNEAPEQVVLVVTKGERVLIGGNPVKRGGLRDKLAAIASVKPDVQVFIQADGAVSYNFVAQVIAEVKKARIQRVGLVTQPAESDTPL